jgi:hypothetical protein
VHNLWWVLEGMRLGMHIYTNSKLLRQRPGANPLCWYKNNIFSKDSDLDDNGQETRSEGNDDDVDDDDDDDGEFLAGGAQVQGENEPWAQQAPNNNVDGPNADAIDWDGSSDEDPLGGADCGNHSPTPSDGGVCSNHGLEDYDDVCNSDDGSDDNVRNENDDESNGNVWNRNDEEAPNNNSSGDEV